MKCLILAAGYATRLYPLTKNFPKPLLKVQGRTILDWLTDDVRRSGAVDEYIIISNHRFAEQFCSWAAGRSDKITVLDDGTETNEGRLGAVRDIELAVKSLEKPCDMLVMAGDNLLDFSLSGFLNYCSEKSAPCIMRYWEPEHSRLIKSGVVTIDDNDKILRMTEKSPEPETNWCCPPFYYYTAEAAELVSKAIAEGCGVDAPGAYIEWLSKQMPVYAMEMPGRRYDIGNIESYEEVKRSFVPPFN